jgi:hypothetical protein
MDRRLRVQARPGLGERRNGQGLRKVIAVAGDDCDWLGLLHFGVSEDVGGREGCLTSFDVA